MQDREILDQIYFVINCSWKTQKNILWALLFYIIYVL